MAQFKDVFSTTAKVLLALVIIAALIGIGYGLLAGIGALSVASSTSQPSPDAVANAARAGAMDTIRSSMPKSEWDRGMARAAKRHCYIGGMNKEEITRALGEPNKKDDWGSNGGAWTWQLPPGKCLKYSGDDCVEQETNHQIVFFTAKGNADESTGLCTLLDGDSVLSDEIFTTLPSR